MDLKRLICTENCSQLHNTDLVYEIIYTTPPHRVKKIEIKEG